MRIGSYTSGTMPALISLASNKLRLKKGLPLQVWDTEGKYVLLCPYFDEYGHGNSYQEALDDLCLSIEGYYFSLKKRQRKLGKYMAEIWKRMQESLEEIGT